MNKIRVIDLLNKIANGEEVPKKIKYNGVIFENNGCNCYLNEKDKSLSYCVEIPMFLNDEVEILEEEKKIPEKLQGSCDMTTSEICRMNNIEVKINEIIDYLKSKGE